MSIDHFLMQWKININMPCIHFQDCFSCLRVIFSKKSDLLVVSFDVKKWAYISDSPYILLR